MGTYTRLGSSLLVSKLASDPLGALHRAVVITGGSFEHHVLVRSFSEELLRAGLDSRLDEASRVAALLAGARAFGLGYRIERGKAPHALWDHVPGRSLAQLIDKAKQDQIPFGVEHALTVIQGLALGIVQMQARGVSHGLINPHCVWVGMDGTIRLLDAPIGSLVKGLLAEMPSARKMLAPYLQGPDNDGFQQDLFALGAVFYELLTFAGLPLGADLGVSLDRATLSAAQEEAPLPTELRAFLGRLLLGLQPFTSVQAFNAELERVLYGGECSPSTFSMAFFMHTLFREENDREVAAMKVEQSQDYLAFTTAGETLPSEPAKVTLTEGLAEAPSRQKNTMLIGAGLIAVLALALGYYFFGRQQVEPAAQKQLEVPKRPQTKPEPQKAEPASKATAEGVQAVAPQKDLTETRPAEEKSKIQKRTGEASPLLLDLERQQKAAEQRLEEQRKKEQRLGERKQPEEK